MPPKSKANTPRSRADMESLPDQLDSESESIEEQSTQIRLAEEHLERLNGRLQSMEDQAPEGTMDTETHARRSDGLRGQATSLEHRMTATHKEVKRLQSNYASSSGVSILRSGRASHNPAVTVATPGTSAVPGDLAGSAGPGQNTRPLNPLRAPPSMPTEIPVLSSDSRAIRHSNPPRAASSRPTRALPSAVLVSRQTRSNQPRGTSAVPEALVSNISPSNPPHTTSAVLEEAAMSARPAQIAKQASETRSPPVSIDTPALTRPSQITKRAGRSRSPPVSRAVSRGRSSTRDRPLGYFPHASHDTSPREFESLSSRRRLARPRASSLGDMVPLISLLPSDAPRLSGQSLTPVKVEALGYEQERPHRRYSTGTRSLPGALRPLNRSTLAGRFVKAVKAGSRASWKNKGWIAGGAGVAFGAVALYNTALAHDQTECIVWA